MKGVVKEKPVTAVMRQALETMPDETKFGETVRLAEVYFPQSHLKALHPDVVVVTGMRGAGKTFWWSALQQEPVRELMRERHERTRISGKTELRTGFGARSDIEKYPSKDVLKRLLERGVVDARMLWRTVQAWQLAPTKHALRQQRDWQSRTTFVRENPELIDRMFAKCDEQLESKDRYVVVLYDALDRSTDDWQSMYRIIRGLLQTALDMRSYRRIRVKMFLRTDQFTPSAIGGFPDASKLLASAVELNWPRRELYGLLWHLLGNSGDSPEKIRSLLCDGQVDLSDVHCGVWQVPMELVFDDVCQRRVFHRIAGQWMGRDRRRGFPYTWIPNHLGDTEGKVSPRSFIAALRAAAKNSFEQHPNHEYALHYDSIKLGVQSASKDRVAELGEDYPWVDRLLRDLERMTVPCRFRDIEKRWVERKTLTRLRENIEEQDVKLPPSSIDDGAEGVRADLEALSVFQRMHDGRVNIPDVFRVGYRLGRKGGVRPVR